MLSIKEIEALKQLLNIIETDIGFYNEQLVILNNDMRDLDIILPIKLTYQLALSNSNKIKTLIKILLYQFD